MYDNNEEEIILPTKIYFSFAYSETGTGFFLLKDASAKLRNEPIKISVEIDRLGFLAETNT